MRTDDLLKAAPDRAPWRPVVGIVPKISDAEVVTLAVMQALLGHTSEARWLRYAGAHLRDLFPYLPKQPGYNKRLRRLGDIVNSFSFQEMELDVVDNYIGAVCAKGVRYAVSLNSREGTDKTENAGEWGSLGPVKSADIIGMFEKRGYTPVGQYDEPLVHVGRQVDVLKKG